MTTFAPGDFSFLEDDYDVLRLTNAYAAVGQEGLWDFFKTQRLPYEKSGFLSWKGAEMARLKPHLDKVGCGHTLHSYAWTLLTIQRIAKEGWDAYVAPYVKEIADKKACEEEMARRRASGGYIPAHWRTAAD